MVSPFPSWHFFPASILEIRWCNPNSKPIKNISSQSIVNSRSITSSAEKTSRNDFFMPCHSAEEQEAPEWTRPSWHRPLFSKSWQQRIGGEIFMRWQQKKKHHPTAANQQHTRTRTCTKVRTKNKYKKQERKEEKGKRKYKNLRGGNESQQDKQELCLCVQDSSSTGSSIIWALQLWDCWEQQQAKASHTAVFATVRHQPTSGNS